MLYRNMCQGWEKRAIIQILFSDQFHFPILFVTDYASLLNGLDQNYEKKTVIFFLAAPARLK